MALVIFFCKKCCQNILLVEVDLLLLCDANYRNLLKNVLAKIEHKAQNIIVHSLHRVWGSNNFLIFMAMRCHDFGNYDTQTCKNMEFRILCP